MKIMPDDPIIKCKNLKWQRPIEWSRETSDGYYYLESEINGKEWRTSQKDKKS